MSKPIRRRTFLKGSAAALGSAAAAGLPGVGRAAGPAAKDVSQVFFTRDLSVEGLLRIYAQIAGAMTGKVAIKLHSGEPHGPNLLPLELIKGLQARVPDSTIVECNVLYPSPRKTTEGHLETLKINGFDFCPVEIMDADGDATIPVPGMRELLAAAVAGRKRVALTPGDHLTELAVGKGLMRYDSLLVYTHFKGHAMGGFGGSLKNIAIGCASGRVGKLQIHGEGWPKGPLFLERMVEAGKAITARFGAHAAYINVLKNLSVDCDCDAQGAKPTSQDIGILGGTDILAIDQASIDLVYAQPERQRRDLVERIESRSGRHQLEYMKALRMGNERYELITV